MRVSLKPIHGLGALACTAAIVGILALTLSDFGKAEEPAAQSSAEQPAAAKKPEQNPVLKTPASPVEPEPQAYVSPPAEESTWQVGNLSVIDLVDGALQARERNDLAYLARCMASNAGKASLVEDDLLAAHRQFKWRSTDASWSKITQSWLERSYEVVEDGDTAELVMQVGGSLGEIRLQFTRKGNAWYFAGI